MRKRNHESPLRDRCPRNVDLHKDHLYNRTCITHMYYLRKELPQAMHMALLNNNAHMLELF